MKSNQSLITLWRARRSSTAPSAVLRRTAVLPARPFSSSQYSSADPNPRVYHDDIESVKSTLPTPSEVPYDAFLSSPLNAITAPDAATSPAYLASIHAMLTPPPPAALSALAARIPGLPYSLQGEEALPDLERCLVTSSFWQGVQEGDVRFTDLQKATSAWTPEVPEPSMDGGAKGAAFLPGKWRKEAQVPQGMDSRVDAHPKGTYMRRQLREKAMESVKPGSFKGLPLAGTDGQEWRPAPGWDAAPVRFTNWLDHEMLHNKEWSALGNSILGMLGAEWLEREYPNLPTKAFQAALTMHVGPRTCADVARLWGISSGSGLSSLTLPSSSKLASQPGSSFASGAHRLAGPGVKHHGTSGRGSKNVVEKGEPGLLRWRRAESADSKATAWESGTTYEDAMASAARAVVGWVYLKSGLKAAREVVRRSWLEGRKPVAGELAAVVKTGDPKGVLRDTLVRWGKEPPTARLLKETGRLTATPVFIVGSYSGSTKLGEAFGSSLAMASFRAHEDALRRLYLSPLPPFAAASAKGGLPSDTLVEGGEGGTWQPGLLGKGLVEVVRGSRGAKGWAMGKPGEEGGGVIGAVRRRREKALSGSTSAASVAGGA